MPDEREQRGERLNPAVDRGPEGRDRLVVALCGLVEDDHRQVEERSQQEREHAALGEVGEGEVELGRREQALGKAGLVCRMLLVRRAVLVVLAVLAPAWAAPCSAPCFRCLPPGDARPRGGPPSAPPGSRRRPPEPEPPGRRSAIAAGPLSSRRGARAHRAGASARWRAGAGEVGAVAATDQEAAPRAGDRAAVAVTGPGAAERAGLREIGAAAVAKSEGAAAAVSTAESS